MTVRALGGIARSNTSERTVHDFRSCDVGLPTHAIFTGGGNRQRRRIHEAVGPTRYNYAKFARTYSNAAWVKGNSGTGSAPSIDSETITDPEGGTTATRVTFDLNGGTTLSDESMLTQYEPSGTTTGATYTQGLWANIPVGKSILVRNVGSSAYTELTGAGQWKRYKSTESSGAGVHLIEIGLRGGLPGAIGSDSATVDLWWSTLEDGPDLTPVVPNDGGTVASTTDYPRRTLNWNGTTPQYGGGGSWSSDGTGDLLPSNTIGPSGHPMSKLARRSASDGCYAYQGNLTFVAGEKYARRIVAQADDDAGDLVFVELATNPGNYIANGTINVRTGAVPAVSNGTIVLIGRIGKQFIFEMRGTAPASVTSGYCSWIVPYAGPVGSGVLFGCDQTEYGEVCTANMLTPLGAGGSSVAPPFGELVDVDSGDPRVQYGEHGFGLGIEISGPTDGEALKFTDMEGFGLNQDAWTIIIEATEPAVDPTGYPMILRMTGPGGVVATINKQQDGRVEFQIYDGATNVARQVAAGTPGSLRRYLLGYDRATQTMRCAATDVGVEDRTNASLATVGPYTVVQLSSADGFWWCNNITAKVEVVKRMLLKEECTQEVAL